MVKIRLSRIGAKGQPYYRVVVVDSRRKRDTKVIETIGHYNPRTEPSSFDIKKDRLEHWRGVGAQLTEPVLVLLGEVEPKKHQPKNVKEEAAPAAAPATPISSETPTAEEPTKDPEESTPTNEEQPAESPEETSNESKAAAAPEETPDASPELAKVVDASEAIAPNATPEEIEQTVENTQDSAKDVQVAEEREPTTQEAKANTAEVAAESDDSTEKV